MSKHIFNQLLNNQKYEIQIGWDKPLQEFYGTILGFIESTDNDCDGYFDDLIWSSIFLKNRPCDLEPIIKEIIDRGFLIPDGLIDNVKADSCRNSVNEYTFYDAPASKQICDSIQLPTLKVK